MEHPEPLFTEFSETSKEAWLGKVEKELKGKPFADLEWHLGKKITLPPFFHHDEVEPIVLPARKDQKDNDWEIGEYIDVEEPKQGNQWALEALGGGVEALLYRFKRAVAAKDIEILLNGIEMSYISAHFGFYFSGKEPWAFFDGLAAYLDQKGENNNHLNGSLDFDPILDWVDPPFEQLQQLLDRAGSVLPRFKVFQVNARRFHHGPQFAVKELALTIAKGNAYLQKLQELGTAPEKTNRHLQFSVALSTSYFVEIAKLRALRLLWANVIQAYGIAVENMPPVEAHLAFESQDEDPNTNMIRASTQALAAVIGGVDQLYLAPSDAFKNKSGTSFSRRIARNVQHLLKMESHLAKVKDPAAGSYYLEQLTRLLAEKAWEEFQEIERKGGFMLLV